MHTQPVASTVYDASVDPPICFCHDAVDCPDEATVTINAIELAEISQLLCDLDEFLRCGNGAAERLADFLATCRHQQRPGFAANNLIDQVGLNALALQRSLTAAGHNDQGGRQ